MRVTTSGRLCNAVHKEARSGIRQRDGQPWDSPETFTVLLCADYNVKLVRCLVSEAQFAELSNPTLFGSLLEVRGDTESTNYGDVLNVASYRLADETVPA